MKMLLTVEFPLEPFNSLVRSGKAAESMEGKTSKSRHDGAVLVLEALKSYGKHFQLPGWRVSKG